MRETRRNDSKPSVWYLAFSVVASQVMSAFVFWSSNIGGDGKWAVVICSLLASVFTIGSVCWMKCNKHASVMENVKHLSLRISRRRGFGRQHRFKSNMEMVEPLVSPVDVDE